MIIKKSAQTTIWSAFLKGRGNKIKNCCPDLNNKGVAWCLAVEAALQLEGVKSFVLKHLSCCGSNKSDSTTMF